VARTIPRRWIQPFKRRIGDTPGGAKPPPPPKPDQTACGASSRDGSCFAVDPGKPLPKPTDPQTTTSNDQPDSGLPVAVEAELLQSWAPTPPVVDVQLSARDSGSSATGTGTDNLYTAAPQGSAAQISLANPAGSDASMQAASGSRTDQAPHLLLAAGRGVYGHAVLEANSDIGGPVLVEIDSGPLVHDRVSGAFQRHDDRLVISFDKLMIGTAHPISISAFAVSPDTGETGVASEVNEHYLTRIVLPAAAAFVQGLGNAIQNGNSTTVSNGLSTNSYSNLSLAQEAGVGAGAAAQQLGQILQKATPQDPTVILKRDDPVGVVFAQPVYAP
jgi:intracellular multiplication protein IcmE